MAQAYIFFQDQSRNQNGDNQLNRGDDAHLRNLDMVQRWDVKGIGQTGGHNSKDYNGQVDHGALIAAQPGPGLGKGQEKEEAKEEAIDDDGEGVIAKA